MSSIENRGDPGAERSDGATERSDGAAAHEALLDATLDAVDAAEVSVAPVISAVGTPPPAEASDALATDPTVQPEALGATRGADGHLPSAPSNPLGRTIAPERLAASADDALCGQSLHHFRVLRLLGRGGMGSVYEAHDLSLDRRVALKVVEIESVASPRTQRLVAEARAQAKLSHANVIPIYYIGVQDRRCFFAMERVDGHDLDGFLSRTERLPWERARELMLGVAKALEAASAQGFVHRDIKPSNLMLTRAGEIKVGDFGLAQPIVRSRDEAMHGFAGTPLYASPEQFTGGELDERSDMYSLGVSFYHLLSGAPPFAGTNLVELARQHTEVAAEPLRSRCPEVPERFAALLDRLLAKSPHHRFATWAELITALEAARPERKRPAGVLVRGIARGLDFTVGAGLTSLLAEYLDWFALLPYLVYLTVAWSRAGHTVGQWLFRIGVVPADGAERLSWGRALARAVLSHWPFPLLVAGDVLTLGLQRAGVLTPDYGRFSDSPAGVTLIALWILSLLLTALSRQRIALHDRVVKSRVVYEL